MLHIESRLERDDSLPISVDSQKKLTINKSMTKKLIIIANAEKLCAYRMLRDEMLQPQAHIERIETELHHLSPDPVEVSDDDGRFPSGSLQHGASMRHGEPHGRISEKKRRLLNDMESAIAHIMDQEDFDTWDLAIPAELSKQFIERLPTHLNQKLKQIKKADYTKLPIKEVEQLFS